MNPIRIIGIGSPFGDDRLGWDVIERLRENKNLMPWLETLHLETCDRPGLHLLNLIRGAEVVVLIDAVKSGAPLGSLHCLQNGEIEQVYPTMSTHNIGIGYALKLARELNELPKKLYFYGIEINEISLTMGFSDPIKQAIILLENKLITLLPGIY